MKIAVISDTHCGSTVGLCPPNFRFIEGGGYNLNKPQRWLWRRWEEAKDWLLGMVEGEKWGLVLNGDAIDGRHHGTVQLISSDFQEHLHCAYDVFMQLADACDHLWLMRGTECHAKTVESTLGKMLEATASPSTGSYCFEEGELRLRINGILSDFRHHVSVSMRPWAKGGPAQRAFRIQQVEAADHDDEFARVCVRSHAHEYDEWRGMAGMCVITPPWQLMSRFARKVTQASLTTPGLVLLDYDDLDERDLPRTHVKLFPPKPNPIITVP